MFLNFYHLRVQPFGVSPDPQFLYLSESHREALASLYSGIQSGHAFLALIAPPGMGKTTLLHRLLEHLRHTARTVFLFDTQCDSREFLRSLLLDLGIASPASDLAELHDQLQRDLLEEHCAGRRVLLVIDEAQNLPEPVLETVRLLSNFETPSAKLLQIILSGQPQLAEVLSRPSLSQLRQRISTFACLQPFTPGQTTAYIRHRLCTAGYSGPRLFTPGALELIARHSHGIPRNINNLCSGALSIACALQRTSIDHQIIREVIADLKVESLHPPALAPTPSSAFVPAATAESLAPAMTRIVIARSLFRTAVAATVLIVLSLLATIGWTLNGGRLAPNSTRAASSPQSAHASSPTAPPRVAP